MFLGHNFKMTLIIDISVPISNQIVTWPGDSAVVIHKTADVCCGDEATVSRLDLGSHTGTHVDAVSHFKSGGATLDEMDLSVYIGPASVVDVGVADVIDLATLEKYDWTNVTRVLFKTKNSQTQWWKEPFNERFVHLTIDGAQFLTAQGVQLIGVDYLSVEGYGSPGAPVHHHLLAHNVHIVEGLYLADVTPGPYELICLPLKIYQGDGAPARVVLRSLATQ